MDEKQQTAVGQAAGRRDFLRAAGLGGAALALAACSGGSAERALTAPGGPAPAVVGPNGVTLDFSNEIDVLNYAYALEQLEAAFYMQVLAAPQFSNIFADNERRVLTDLRDHEVVHREFFEAAIPSSQRIPDLTPNFSAVNFGDRTSVLQTARTFEDLGVRAYNGAGRYIKSAVYLTLAGKIVSVEARHASAIRDLLVPRSGGMNGFAPNPFDEGLSPQNVLAAADPFIVQNITVINA